MSAAERARLDACGCCEAAGSATPIAVWNRSGLTAIDYRVGTYASFRRAMLDAIASDTTLGAWTARTDADYGIALISMWAYVGDILTFYQERIANEAFLRTARHRDAVLRLANLLDYRLGPGSAALAWLAFTTEKDKPVRIPLGLRVQSVPGQDEKPQKFETLETFSAEPALNRARIFPQPAPYDALGQGSLGGRLTSDPKPLAVGQRLVLFTSPGGRLAARITFGFGSGPLPAGALAQLHAARDLLTTDATLGAIIAGYADGVTPATEGLVLSQRWADSVRDALVSLGVAASRMEVVAFGARNPIDSDATEAGRARNRRVEILITGLRVGVEEKQIEAIPTRDGASEVVFTPAVQERRGTAIRYRRKYRLFGYHAPETYLSGEVPEGTAEDAQADDIKWAIRSTDFTRDESAPRALDLDAAYDDLKTGTEVLVVVDEDALGTFALRRRIERIETASAVRGPLKAGVTRLVVDAEILPGVSFDVRNVTLYELQGAELTFWDFAYGSEIAGALIYLPTAAVPSALQRDRQLILDDVAGAAERVRVISTGPVPDVHPPHLAIAVEPALTRPLAATSAFALGNVALASHGEKVPQDVLGSGNAAQAFQSFKLKKKPLTHVPKEGAPQGAESSLQLWVDGVLWRQVRSLYGQPPEARVFVARIGDDGATTVHTGDQRTGARLPTGVNNVIARYRQGLGAEGRLRAGALSVLLDRPAGLRAASNPFPTEGGFDPETLAEARANAPNTVRTFERIVSLRDFEDEARAFTGVAKARASWAWRGERRVVRLTVAGEDGLAFGDETMGRLVRHLDARRDAHQRMEVSNYRPVSVLLEVTVDVAGDRRAEDVGQAVRDAILTAFAFETLELGQPVQLSEIYRVVQDVDGIVAADIDRLMIKRRAGLSDAEFLEDLQRRGIRFEGGEPVAVQPRLLLHPDELARIEDPTSDLDVSTRTAPP